MEFESRGRVWTEAGREPYTRVDGTETELIRWQIKCAKCDAMAEITTPATGYEKSKAWGAVHCNTHKMTQQQVMQRWNEQRKANKQKKADSNA
jgi:hypothetical protein